METRIEVECDSGTEVLVLSTKLLNNLNYVDIWMDGGDFNFMATLDTLISALKAFDENKKRST